MSQAAATLSHDDVVEKVKAIVTEALHIRKTDNQLSEDTYLENLGLDSLNIVNVILALEAEFGIAFDEEELDLEPLESVGTLVAFVMENQAAT